MGHFEKIHMASRAKYIFHMLFGAFHNNIIISPDRVQKNFKFINLKRCIFDLVMVRQCQFQVRLASVVHLNIVVIRNKEI